MHGGPQALAHMASYPVGTRADHAVNLKRTVPFLAGQHKIQHLEPGSKRVVRILKDGADVEREAIGMGSAFMALPRPCTLGFVKLLVSAAGASRTCWPTPIHEIALAGILIRKEPIVGKSHLPNTLGLTLCECFVHATENSNSNASLVTSSIIAKRKWGFEDLQMSTE